MEVADPILIRLVRQPQFDMAVFIVPVSHPFAYDHGLLPAWLVSEADLASIYGMKLQLGSCGRAAYFQAQTTSVSVRTGE